MARELRRYSSVDLDEFLRAYIETALWSSTDDDGTPLDRNFDERSFTRSSLAKMHKDAVAFVSKNAEMIIGREGLAGHDFWLTRNRHGAGFWDGDWPEPDATKLTNASHAFGEQDIVVSRNKLHLFP